MKKFNVLILVTIVASLILAACAKERMTENQLAVNINHFEIELNTDYSNALKFHNSLSALGMSTAALTVHHQGTSTGTSSDASYYKMMFQINDSLFSKHFYDFCIDMMKSGDMMNTSVGMMGNESHMSGGYNSMMKGCPMENHENMDSMINYMDSIHLSTETMMNPNYYFTDSLMYRQMSECKMMSSKTEGIDKLYANMQDLRKSHMSHHGI